MLQAPVSLSMLSILYFMRWPKPGSVIRLKDMSRSQSGSMCFLGMGVLLQKMTRSLRRGRGGISCGLTLRRMPACTLNPRVWMRSKNSWIHCSR